MSFRQGGFTLIEVLVTAFVLSVVTLAITGLALVITRVSIESERATVAQGLLNEKLENLRAAYNELGYEVIAYSDESPLGMVDKEKTETRNNLDYLVHGFITLIDDPANGTLPEGTPLTDTSADYAQVLYKASWTSNLGDNVGYAPGLAPVAHAAPSSVVAAATFFNLKPVDKVCTPGTETCRNPFGCTPGTPAACPDEDGNYTLDCPSDGVCSGSKAPAFVKCPASGKCSDAVGDDGSGAPPSDPPLTQCDYAGISGSQMNEACIGGQACFDGDDNDSDGKTDMDDPTCQKMAWQAGNQVDDDGDGLVDEPDEGAALFEPVGRCLTEVCPHRQLWREIGPVSTPAGNCGVTAHCGTTRLFWRSCLTTCNDGIPDANGIPDNLNPACAPNGVYDPNDRNANEARPECSDQFDNDHDEGIDLADGSCSSASDNDEWCPIVDQNSCQKKHTCPEFSTCLPPTASDPAKACWYDIGGPKCWRGLCWECLAVTDPIDGEKGAEDCQAVAQNNPNIPDAYCLNTVDGDCICRNGLCAQCSAVNAEDNNCPEKKPLCFVGACAAGTPGCSPKAPRPQCVECINDSHCPLPGGNQLATHCRIVKGDPEHSHQCDARPACRDTFDNDGDGLVDGNDPGCTSRDDNEERDDIAPLEEPLPACSDGIDNDNPPDGLIDVSEDPGCIDANDNDETDPAPPAHRH